MFKPASIFLFISGLLLISCNPELIPASENMVEPLGRKRIKAKYTGKEVEHKRRKVDSLRSVSIAEETAESRAQQLTETDEAIFQSIKLPDELMLQVFSELSVKDIAHASGVCRHWQMISEEPILWKAVRLRIHGDYPASEATKKQAIKHILRVYVNMLSDRNTVAQLIHKHKLNKQHPLYVYKDLLIGLYNSIPEIIEEYVSQGHEKAINLKIEWLLNSKNGYEHNPSAAVYFNEYLIQQGNEAAIRRKIDGLANGWHGYEYNPTAAVYFNEYLIQQGNVAAIIRKIWGLAYGDYGYEYNPEAAAIYNDSLIEQGDEKAIMRKIKGLMSGEYGYERNPQAAVALNDSLVEQGHEEAIERERIGLIYGENGYDRNPADALVLNESLVEQGDEGAIRRKIEWILRGSYNYGYGYNSYTRTKTIQLKSWIEKEADKRTRWACYLKAQGLKYGILGFEKNREAAIKYILANGIPY